MMNAVHYKTSPVASVPVSFQSPHTIAPLHPHEEFLAACRLAGDVGHELNNSLAVIRGNADLLAMDAAGLGDDAAHSLKQIVTACEHAANLTQQLLLLGQKQTISVACRPNSPAR